MLQETNLDTVLYNDEMVDQENEISKRITQWKPEIIPIGMYQESEFFALKLLEIYQIQGCHQKEEIIHFGITHIQRFNYGTQIYLIHKYKRFLEIGEIFCELFKSHPALCNYLAQKFPKEVSLTVVNCYRKWIYNENDMYENYDDGDNYNESELIVPTSEEFPVINSDNERQIETAEYHKKEYSRRMKIISKHIRCYKRMVCLLQFHYVKVEGIDKEQLAPTSEITYVQIKNILKNYPLDKTNFPLFWNCCDNWCDD